jgi:PAS domain S-box-containing protein
VPIVGRAEESGYSRAVKLAHATVAALLDRAALYVVAIDAARTVVHVSAALASALARPEEEILGAPLASLVGGDRADALAGGLSALAAGGEGRVESCLAYGLAIEWRAAVDAGDGVIVALGAAPSREAAADVELRESQERFVAAERVANVGSFEVDSETRRATWSEQMYRILEVDPSQREGLFELFISRIHPETRAGSASRFQEVVQANAPLDVSGRLMMPDGRVKYVRVRAKVIRLRCQREDAPGRLVGTVEDTTDRVVAEQAMRRMREELATERNLLRALIDAFPGYVGLYTADGGFVDANQRSLQASQRSRSAGAGERLWETPVVAANPRFAATVHDGIARAAAGERVRFDVEPSATTTGAEIDMSISPIRDERGVVTHIATYGVDVSERNRALRQLRESESRLKHAQQIAKLGSWEMDHALGRVSWSEEVYTLLGLDPEVVKPSLAAFLGALHPEDRERAKQQLVRDVRAGGALRVVVRVQGAGGVARWMQLIGETSSDAAGAIVHSFGTIQDITERVLAEHREDDLRAHAFVLGAIGEGVAFIDAKRHIRFTNAAFDSLFGYASGELIGAHVSALADTDGEASRRVLRSIDVALREAGLYVGQLRLRRKDGTVLYTHTRISPLEVRGERLFVAIQDDATEQVRAEQEVRRARDLLRSLIDSSPDWIHVKDLEHKFILVNSAFAAAHGLTPEDFVGRPDTDFFSQVECMGDAAAGTRGFHDDDNDAFEGRLVRRPDVRVTLADGVPRVYDTHKRPLRDESGRVYGVLGYTREVTEQKRAADLLQQALSEKETLLREIHHRVKNNLQIVSGLLHFQAKKVTSPEDAAAFKDGQKRLLAMMLVHDKLYQSTELARVELGEYVRSLTSALAQSFDGQRVQLEVQTAVAHVPVDMALTVGMVLCELVTNLFKYAYPPGSEGVGRVCLTYVRGVVVLDVRDGGRGFRQGFDPLAATSFGWHLVKSLVEQLDGAITVTADPGVHVEVRFGDPYRAASASLEARPERGESPRAVRS